MIIALIASSKIRIGKKIRISGLPAVLLGVSAVVASLNVSRSLPEILRQTRALEEHARPVLTTR